MKVDTAGNGNISDYLDQNPYKTFLEADRVSVEFTYAVTLL